MPPDRSLARRVLPIVAVLLVIALRNAALLTSPRFWAEEGTMYFRAAHDLPWYQALTSCPQGYYNLPCQLGALASALLPLEAAPYGTTIVAMLLQALPPLLLLRVGRLARWSPLTTTMAVIVALLAPPLHEVWLTTTNSLHYLVGAGALAIHYWETLALGALGGWLLLGIGLSSGYALAVVPMAVWLAFRQAGRSRWRSLAWLATAIGVQVLCNLVGGISDNRTLGASPSVALAVIATKCWVVPFAGLDCADRWGLELAVAHHAGTLWRWAPLLALPSAVAFATAIGCRSRSAIVLLVTGHVVALTAILGGLGDKVSMIGGLAFGRYFVPVLTLHLLAAIECLRTTARWWWKVLPSAFLVFGTFEGLCEYGTLMDHYNVGPDWRREVAQWRADPDRPPSAWPQGWKVHFLKR